MMLWAIFQGKIMMSSQVRSRQLSQEEITHVHKKIIEGQEDMHEDTG